MLLKCKHCSKIFDRKYDYNRHINQKRSCKPKENNQGLNTCDICKKGFYSIYTLKRHQDNPPVSCTIMAEMKDFKNRITENENEKQPVINKTTKIKNSKRTKICGHTKKIVAHSQDWKCKICKAKLPANYETDHITPLFKGGNNELTNLQALCNNCHGEKSIFEQSNKLSTV